MINDGNGTCYDKTTYQTFVSQHEGKYVMQVKEGGSATDPKPISDCLAALREPAKFLELTNKGGYAAKDGTPKSANPYNVIILFLECLWSFLPCYQTELCYIARTKEALTP